MTKMHWQCLLLQPFEKELVNNDMFFVFLLGREGMTAAGQRLQKVTWLA